MTCANSVPAQSTRSYSNRFTVDVSAHLTAALDPLFHFSWHDQTRQSLNSRPPSGHCSEWWCRRPATDHLNNAINSPVRHHTLPVDTPWQAALSEASLCGVSDLVCYGLTSHFTYYGEFWKLVQNTQSSQPSLDHKLYISTPRTQKKVDTHSTEGRRLSQPRWLATYRDGVPAHSHPSNY